MVTVWKLADASAPLIRTSSMSPSKAHGVAWLRPSQTSASPSWTGCA
jgi:hypothetical protein